MGCGQRLRQAREAAGLSLDEVAGQLRMPVQVVAALEAEQWERMGAPVFVRGQLRSYAKLLKVDLGELLEQARIAPVVPPTLVSHTHTPPIRRMAENLGRRAVYVVITAVLAVPIWYVISNPSRNAPPSTASLDVVPPASSAGTDAALPAATAAAQPATRQEGPYIASLAPAMAPRAAAEVPKGGLTLNFKGDSWVDISGPDGATVEKALIRAGESRSFSVGQVGRMVLGNAAQVEVQQAGANVDMTPYQRGNVARFTVSSDGSVVPVSR